jgi:hypothetical protein
MTWATIKHWASRKAWYIHFLRIYFDLELLRGPPLGGLSFKI